MFWLFTVVIAVAYIAALFGAGWVAVGLRPGFLRSLLWVLPFALSAIAPLVLPPGFPPLTEYAQSAALFLCLTAALVWALRRQFRE
jgi:hypothetical protein